MRNHKGGRRDMTESEHRRFKGLFTSKTSFNNLIRCKVATYGNPSPHANCSSTIGSGHTNYCHWIAAHFPQPAFWNSDTSAIGSLESHTTALQKIRTRYSLHSGYSCVSIPESSEHFLRKLTSTIIIWSSLQRARQWLCASFKDNTCDRYGSLVSTRSSNIVPGASTVLVFLHSHLSTSAKVLLSL